ncbi:MAG: hypothetical protein R3C53_20365 [Pirellulaceae bacterium]
MIYTHVLARPDIHVVSPLDRLQNEAVQLDTGRTGARRKPESAVSQARGAAVPESAVEEVVEGSDEELAEQDQAGAIGEQSLANRSGRMGGEAVGSLRVGQVREAGGPFTRLLSRCRWLLVRQC